MRIELAWPLLLLTIILAAIEQNNASPSIERLLQRRQSGESEQESTTPKSAPENSQQAPRLYPDLPRQPNFLPPFNAPPINGYQAGPLVPFGIQMPPANRLNADQQPGPFGRMPPQPRPMTSAERLQSQSFAHGLGKRLLAMVGIDTEQAGPRAEASSGGDQQPGDARARMDDTSRALQNATVLEQLNKGIGSIYGGLSKMYNSTVQQQLNLLQERFKSETANSTNPWHQRMAQQVPAFFKQMANKVAEAQGQLDRVWRDMSQVNGSMLSQANDQARSFFGSFDRFLNNPTNGDFFNQAFGMGDTQAGGSSNGQANGTNQGRNLMLQLRDMWQRRVEPELMTIRGQVSRVWRDLVNNGALTQETLLRARQNNLASSSKNDSSSSDLVDSILKEVDINGAEYSLVEPKSEASTGAESARQESAKPAESGGVKMSPQMQNRLVETQSELNRLWMGLTNSLQVALMNVKRAVNPQPQFEFAGAGAGAMDTDNKQMEDPVQNEISDKIKDLAKLQRDTDMVRDAVQQQQREAERRSLGDRFRGFFNGVDMQGMNQLPDRIGEQFNRFGTAVGNFWNRLPERWDNFMTNMRQSQPAQIDNRLTGASSSGITSATSTTTTSAPSEK